MAEAHGDDERYAKGENASAASSSAPISLFDALGASRLDTSEFSTSSVDQFLRENGFNIEDHAGAELSSLSGDEEELDRELEEEEHGGDGLGLQLEGAQQRNEVARARESGDDGDDAQPPHGDRQQAFRGTQSASEEEEPTTPRFTLLSEKDFLLVSSSDFQEESGNNVQVERGDREDEEGEQDADSLDRSMVLGAGSGFSDFSSSGTGEHSRIAQILHEEEQAAAANRENMRQQVPPPPAPSSRDQPSVSTHQNRISSSASSSLPSSHSSGSRRVQDDELSDALGVTTSTPEQVSSSITRDNSTRIPRSSVQRHTGYTRHTPSTVRRSQRTLFSAPEEESKESGLVETGDANQQHSVSTEPRLSSRPSIPAHLEADANDGFADSDIGEGSWSDLNDLLRKNGLQVVQLQNVDADTLRSRAGGKITIPVRDSLFNLVQDMALQLERKDQIIQDIILESNRSSKEQSRTEGDLVSVEKRNEDIQNALDTAKAEIARLQANIKQGKEDANEQAKKLRQSCLRLQQQLKVSEHRVKAKEVLVDRMQQKLQQQVDKENLNKTRDRQVFHRIQQRDVRKSNARDNQSLEYISIYEAQREHMQEEIDQLKSQVTALNAELRDKENYIARKAALNHGVATWEGDDESFGSPVNGSHRAGRRKHVPGASVSSDDMMLERLEAARREQEQAAATLRRREAAMIKKVSMIEQELVLAHETIGELKEENANLTLEAESRPSIRDYRLCQRRIHQLERQVSESKLALEEAKDLNELRKYMGTKELVERDRMNHRLHLNRLNTLPRETTLEVVKEVCRVLNLTDITLISPSLEKLCHVVAAVPRMEKFIRDVCGFVFLNVHAHVDAQDVDKAGFELEQVLPTLQQWTAERRKLHSLEEFKAAVVTELCKRSIEPSILPNEKDNGSPHSQRTTLSRAVHIVSELVELEKNVLHHREIYSQAATEIERRPSVLVNQIVRHFSHLFQVKSIDGVLPKINEVYMFTNEMTNFLRVVRGLLDLQEETSVVACLNAIREKLEDEGAPPRSPELGARERQRTNVSARNDEPNFVVEKNSRAYSPDGGTGLTGVREVREMTVLVRALKRELGAASMHEILPRTKRLMELLSLSIHNNSVEGDED